MPEDIYNIPRTFGSPNRFALGANAVEKFNLFVPLLGKRGFLFGGSTSLSTCEDSIRDSLGEAGAEVVAYSSGERYCTDEATERLAEQGEAEEAEFIVGVGGGSVMDLAKLVADEMGVKVALVNTVATTNGAISALSVVYTDEEHAFKRYDFFSRSPELVVMDTKIVAESPTHFLVSGMGDASACKWESEACWNSSSRNLLDHHVESGLPTQASLTLSQLSHDVLMDYGVDAKEACEAEVVTPALNRVVEANTLLTGLGFESSGLAAAHSIHNGLTVLENVDGTHGGMVGFGVLTQLVLENQPKEEIKKMVEFYDSVGLPITLDAFNVEVDQLDAVAEAAVAEGETIHNEPVGVSKELALDSMKYANRIGTLYKEGEKKIF